jgi:hypothetical protein
MTTDVSGFGAQVQIKASETFPQGFVVTQFADDADPFDIPSIQIADKAMGLNGDMVTWSRANPITITINVVPGSDDDRNLAILLEANRPGKGKRPAQDIITVVAAYPDEGTLTLTEGKLTDGPPGKSIASAGRLKSNAYQFAFENKTDTR